MPVCVRIAGTDRHAGSDRFSAREAVADGWSRGGLGVQGRRDEQRSGGGQARCAGRRIDDGGLARAYFDLRHRAAHGDPSLDDGDAQSLTRARQARRVADRLFGGVQGAANADRRCRCLKAVIVAIALSDCARGGPDCASQETVERPLAGGVELVFVDPELGARLHRHHRAIAEAKLRVALNAGDHQVAGTHLLALAYRHARRCPAAIANQLDFAAHHDHAGVLRQRNQRQHQRSECQRGHGPATVSGHGLEEKGGACRTCALTRWPGGGGHRQNR